MKNSVKRIISALVLLLFIFSLTVPVYADSNYRMAKITELKGTVKVMKAGGEKAFTAFKTMGLVQGDKLITGKDSSATLEMDSDKEVKVAANTQVLMSELAESIEKNSTKTSISLLGGKIMVNIKKKLVNDSKFEIKTPTVTMGVKGTRFYVGQEEDQTQCAVLEGHVIADSPPQWGAIFANPLDGHSVMIQGNQQLTVPAAPQPNEQLQPAPVTTESLDLFALECIRDDPSRVDPSLLRNIDQVIQQKQQEQQQVPTPVPPPPAPIIIPPSTLTSMLNTPATGPNPLPTPPPVQPTQGTPSASTGSNSGRDNDNDPGDHSQGSVSISSFTASTMSLDLNAANPQSQLHINTVPSDANVTYSLAEQSTSQADISSSGLVTPRTNCEGGWVIVRANASKSGYASSSAALKIAFNKLYPTPSTLTATNTSVAQDYTFALELKGIGDFRENLTDKITLDGAFRYFTVKYIYRESTNPCIAHVTINGSLYNQTGYGKIILNENAWTGQTLHTLTALVPITPVSGGNTTLAPEIIGELGVYEGLNHTSEIYGIAEPGALVTASVETSEGTYQEIGSAYAFIMGNYFRIDVPAQNPNWIEGRKVKITAKKPNCDASDPVYKTLKVLAHGLDGGTGLNVSPLSESLLPISNYSIDYRFYYGTAEYTTRVVDLSVSPVDYISYIKVNGITIADKEDADITTTQFHAVLQVGYNKIEICLREDGKADRIITVLVKREAPTQSIMTYQVDMTPVATPAVMETNGLNPLNDMRSPAVIKTNNLVPNDGFTLNYNTKVVFRVNGTDYTISSSELQTAFDGSVGYSQAMDNVIDTIGNAKNSSNQPLSDVLDVVRDRDNQLRFITKNRGQSATLEIIFSTDDPTQDEASTVSWAFGFQGASSSSETGRDDINPDSNIALYIDNIKFTLYSGDLSPAFPSGNANTLKEILSYAQGTDGNGNNVYLSDLADVDIVSGELIITTKSKGRDSHISIDTSNCSDLRDETAILQNLGLLGACGEYSGKGLGDETSIAFTVDGKAYIMNYDVIEALFSEGKDVASLAAAISSLLGSAATVTDNHDGTITITSNGSGDEANVAFGILYNAESSSGDASVLEQRFGLQNTGRTKTNIVSSDSRIDVDSIHKRINIEPGVSMSELESSLKVDQQFGYSRGSLIVYKDSTMTDVLDYDDGFSEDENPVILVVSQNGLITEEYNVTVSLP